MFYLIKSDALSTLPSSTKRILLVNLVGHGFGGLETHVLNLYKQLAARGHHPLLLVAAHSPLHQRCEKDGLHYYAARGHGLRGFRHLFGLIFAGLCKRHNIRAIHCNNRFEVPSAVRVGKRFGARVIFNYHVPDPFDTSILRGVDAAIAPAPEAIRYIQEENRTKHLGIATIQALPPLFDADRFLSFRSEVSREQWFREQCGIALQPCPAICSIGNMVTDLEHKNYPLLFEALAILILKQNKPVQAILIGDGPMRSYLEQLAVDRGIRDYVHFLGYSSEHGPGVLHYSDAFVLASNKEAFGIVYLEAGLMKKPAIGARNTGAEAMIVDGKTGLLFENGNASSLAACIERVVDDPVAAQQMGAQGFEHIMRTFVPEMVIPKYEALYSTGEE